MRPPYGDIDDRVRAIALQMGLQPIIWTSVNGSSFDTFDWEVAGGVVNADTVVKRFETIIGNSDKLSTGFIVLEHDLYQQSTSLAVDYVLPYALAKTNPALTLMPIYQCLGLKLADAYIETSTNKSANLHSSTVDRSSSATGAAQGIGGAAASSKPNSAMTTRAAATSVIGLVLAAAVACML